MYCKLDYCLPEGAATLSSKSSLQGQSRKRRSTLMIVKTSKTDENKADVKSQRYQSDTDPSEEPQRSIVVQQFSGVVDGAQVHR